jgi:hypothetical protein
MRRSAPVGGLLLALLAMASSASAVDTLGDLRKRGAIVWGGDQEGGGPYVYPRDDDPSRVTGFEVGEEHVPALPERARGDPLRRADECSTSRRVRSIP